VATAFPDASLGAAAQGWLRAAGAGLVTPTSWSPPDFLIATLQALFLSQEDIGVDVAGTVAMFQRVPVGALTVGAAGAVLFVNGERYDIRPHPVQEVDATGAGDVFAAAFLIEYHRHGNAWDAAAVAACAGALAVQGDGIAAVPDRVALDEAVRRYRQAE
jgi:sugar/nucleoside kinase (ribokinase family)